ncbi:hotdog fold thioesterase [Helcobacillus massiliensis]|nr:hotdog fold thioesterase [Helcobacillus massiliensis]MCG7427837.1 hotdog fold thioesterase [Helcobacillus sp. ACRRO]MCT1558514.1 hotdog fold thioesterase [Helcobacillus massiliensis]MCT2036053.1 hotdog fold thioesterase [Helcobacillus massiliensis]MCT2332753.1 hotdog fold thioesterase [Helcobacillus massiliensis]MDK7741613.1 hotdog fold thioesterase [Helcobacillus massiliensis]
MTNPSDPQALAGHHPMLENDFASQWMGVEVVRADYGDALVRMRLRREMLNGHGTAHGGMIFAFADTAFAIACNDAADLDSVTVASGVDINFLRPATDGQVLTAHAVAQHEGRSGIYDVTVTAQDPGADGSGSGPSTVVALFRGRSRTVPRR